MAYKTEEFDCRSCYSSKVSGPDLQGSSVLCGSSGDPLLLCPSTHQGVALICEGKTWSGAYLCPSLWEGERGISGQEVFKTCQAKFHTHLPLLFCCRQLNCIGQLAAREAGNDNSIRLPMCPRRKGRMDFEEQPIVSHKHLLYTRCHSHSYNQEDMVLTSENLDSKGKESNESIT